MTNPNAHPGSHPANDFQFVIINKAGETLTASSDQELNDALEKRLGDDWWIIYKIEGSARRIDGQITWTAM